MPPLHQPEMFRNSGTNPAHVGKPIPPGRSVPVTGGACMAVGTALERLHEEAFRHFGARCLWNCLPSATREGMRVVAERLRRFGGMDAWKLAARIREELAVAP